MPPHSSSNASSAAPGDVTSPPGYALAHYDSLDSTNEEAHRLVRAGVAKPTWIWATDQTAGRGRRGRAWVSQTGNLFCTLLLPLERSPSDAAQLSFVAALAVLDVVRFFSEDRHIALKWPNDVLVGGKKVSGILLETVQASSSPPSLIAIGIGINVASYPDDTELPATSLQVDGKSPSSADALRQLMPSFDRWYRTWERDGFELIRKAWLEAAAGLGQRLDVRLPGETLTGVFGTITSTGALELVLPDGNIRTISAGEIFFADPSS